MNAKITYAGTMTIATKPLLSTAYYDIYYTPMIIIKNVRGDLVIE